MSRPVPLIGPALLLLALPVTGAFAERDAGPAKPPPVKHFTLRQEKVLLSRALDELARQTGVRVEDTRGLPDATLSVEADRLTFWQGIDSLADTVGAAVLLPASDGMVSLVKRPEGSQKPPMSYDGPFRVVVRKVSAMRDLDRNSGACMLTLEVAWVPGLLPLFLETKPQGLRVLDHKRKPLALEDQGSVLAEVDGKFSLNVEVTVPALPRAAPSIALIEGALSAVAPSKMLAFQFDTLHALANDASKRRLMQEGAVCRIDKLTLVKDRWTVRVALELAPGGKKLESFQANSWVANNEIALVSIDGKRRMLPSSYVLESATSRRAFLSYHFVDQGAVKRGKPTEWKVVYRTPASIVDVPLRFRFANVPLP